MICSNDEVKRLKAFKEEHKRLAALSQQQMMSSVAKRSRKQEEACDGLVIESAIYGHESAIHNPTKVRACEDAIDVTIVLQFMVKESRLRLYAGSKREYMGMWVSEKEEEDRVMLLVRYRWKGSVWEIEVTDEEPLYLPAFRAIEIGKSEVVSV